MQKVILFENARILNPAKGLDCTGSLVVSDGVISDGIPSGRSVQKVDLDGAWLMPGLIDLHVHFREPGGETSETLASGARAAARGGFTSVVTMPNTMPPMDDPELLAGHRAASKHLPVEIYPAACCTRGRAGRELADMRALCKAGARAFTDDGAMVEDDAVMEQVMRIAAELDCVVMDHAVVPELAGDGVIRAGAVASEYGLPVFPDRAEVEAVARNLRLCRLTGARTHIQHISCAGTVDLLKEAQKEGLPLSGEVTPHHLMLAVEDIPGNDANWKMNPPLGTRADVVALRKAVVDGTISCLATDHAPHAAKLKAGGFLGTMFGVLGLETAVGATLQALVVESGMAPLAWAAAWTVAPAELLRLPVPTLTAGQPADICVVRPEDWVVAETDLASLSTNSPFIGKKLHGRVELTMRSGIVTHSLRKDLVVE